MSDQANDLRRLMVERAKFGRAASGCARRWIAVAGGKGGVGTTTVAIDLALADGSRKTLLVDADPRGGDAACSSASTITTRCATCWPDAADLRTSCKRGPNGVRLVPGAAAGTNWAAARRQSVERFLETLGDGDVETDTVDHRRARPRKFTEPDDLPPLAGRRRGRDRHDGGNGRDRRRL